MSALSDRFWAKVEKSEDCWLWTAATDEDGYGRILVDGKNRLAHRVSYALEHGQEAAGKLDHTCRHRSCVRPSHLRVATHAQNMQNLGARKSKSGHRGVDPSGSKWMARLRVNRKSIYLGTFDTVEEAAAAAAEGRKRHMPFTIEVDS